MTDGKLGGSRGKVIRKRWRVRVVVGRRVCLGWLWIKTHGGIQRRKGGIEMWMRVELVEIMVLLGRWLVLTWVKGELTREVVMSMRWMLLLLLMLVIVRGRWDIVDIMGWLWTVRGVIEPGTGTVCLGRVRRPLVRRLMTGVRSGGLND